MTTLNATDRGELAETLLPVAAYLSTVVHGDGSARDIHQALSRLDATERDALIVVLAGLADPDRPLGALLGWLDFDEQGRAVQPDWNDRTTLRDLAEEYPVRTAPPDIDEVAIRLVLAGEDVELTPRERIVAYAEGRKLGMAIDVLDALLDPGARGSVRRSWERAKRRARDVGRPDPSMNDAFKCAA